MYTSIRFSIFFLIFIVCTGVRANSNAPKSKTEAWIQLTETWAKSYDDSQRQKQLKHEQEQKEQKVLDNYKVNIMKQAEKDPDTNPWAKDNKKN